MATLTTKGTGQARILIVDDEPGNVRVLHRILARAGYVDVVGTTDPLQVAALCDSRAPDLVLLDLNMPGRDGFAVMGDLAARTGRDDFLPILVLTGDITMATRQRALSEGATDFLTKPFDTTEVLLRSRNLLRIRLLHAQVARDNEDLEARVRERTRQLEEARHEVLERLAMAGECRDDDTGQHTRRVAEVTALIAGELGLDAERVELLRRAAPLHDVGKIGIPDAILLKGGRLSPEEYEVMKSHTRRGAELLAGSRSPLLQTAERIASAHHEHWNGAGYPNGLRGEAIPLEARIVAVADAFDALTHDRPYRAARSIGAALTTVQDDSGRQFDPAVVDALARIIESGQAWRVMHGQDPDGGDVA